MPELAVAEILVGDLVALIDAEDYALVAPWRWHQQPARNGTIYARTSVREPGNKWTHTYMHRLIMDAPLGADVDHINHDGLDNRRSNLRLATRSQNLGNARMYSSNRSGFRGVSWFRKCQKWRAQIVVGGEAIYLGLFDDPLVAASAYNAAAIEHFEEFASTNTELRTA